MAYLLLVHGWGTDPKHFLKKEYSIYNYKTAYNHFSRLFNHYQHQLETDPVPQPFTCLLQTRGIIDNGKKEEKN